MYDVALSVVSCLRANTEVHVAWIAGDGPSDGSEAVALTPGGGHIGSLLGGALDSAIAAGLPKIGASGGILDIELGPAESLITGLPQGTKLEIAVAPGAAIPGDVWTSLVEREPVSLAFELEGRRFTRVEVLDASAEDRPTEGRLVCRFQPIRRAIIMGGGPIADALERAFDLVGWMPMVVPPASSASGITATLSAMDAVVVMGHDVETSSRALQAAIESKAGYIGSLGSQDMQELRREWLAYRSVEWSSRIHGPAGLRIGADNPGEIAIAIVAEAVAVARREDSRDG